MSEARLCGYGRGRTPGMAPCASAGVVRVVLPAWDALNPHHEVDLCVVHARLATRQEAKARADFGRIGLVPRVGRVRWAWWSTVISGVSCAERDATRAWLGRGRRLGGAA